MLPSLSGLKTALTMLRASAVLARGAAISAALLALTLTAVPVTADTSAEQTDAVSEETGVEDAGIAAETQGGESEAGAALDQATDADAAHDEAAMASSSAAEWVNNLGLAVLVHQMRNGSESDLVSPLGLATVMAMLADGANGDTAEGYAIALGLADATEALPGVADLWEQMKTPREGMVVQGANGLWSAPEIDLKPDFAARQMDMLDAAVETVDFTSSETLGRINGWFGEHTGGMIPELFDVLDPQTKVILGNALYLRGDWMEPFDPEQTRPEPFHTAAGAEVEVQMMHRNDSLLYREDELHQSVHLAFADSDYEVTILLPKPDVAAAALLSASTGGRLAPALDPDGFRPTSGHFAMPRLDMNLGGDVTDTLRMLGLLAGQDYSGFAEGPIVFDQVVHRTALKLDETGAEAAAATAAVGVRSATAMKFEMLVNRPFVLNIRHRESGMLLFVGHIGRP